MRNKTPQRLLSLSIAALLCASVDAQVLMLNFRDSGGPTGGNLTNSPYHTADPSFTDTTWNNVSNSDVATGLNYADGTAATGVAFNLGVANLATNTTVDLATNPSSASNLGSRISSGIYAGDSVGKGGIFDGGGADRTVIGLQVTGLDAGTYEVYVSGLNTNINFATGDTVPYVYAAGTGTAGQNFDFSSYSSQSVTFVNSVSTTSWVEEGNYGKITVTLAAGEALNIISNGDGGTVGGSPANRGFLNSVQIAVIPEPGAWALIIGLGALVAVGFWRRRR